MERLTDSTNYCSSWSGCDMDEEACVINGICYDRKIYNKLKEYEDLEEQGLLLKLPLAKEDAFWEINRGTIPPSCYKRYAHSYQHCVYVLERLGKTCFLTEAEAEKALGEMEK